MELAGKEGGETGWREELAGRGGGGGVVRRGRVGVDR